MEGKQTADKVVVIPLPTLAWSTATTLPLLLAKQNKGFTRKETK
jgi:hypothetical protein